MIKMMKKVCVFLCLVMMCSAVQAKKKKEVPVDDRMWWCEMAYRISYPVLDALSKGELKQRMPVEAPAPESRRKYAHLEAFGRLLCGMAPWLELGADDTPEGRMRGELLMLARKAIRNAVDPASPDYMNFTLPSQPLVDAAFLAQGLMRAPQQLWGGLDEETRRMVIDALLLTRGIKPFQNNWLLFSGMIETFLLWAGEPWDAMRLDYALVKHEDWYRGDGAYGDGPDFHWDYYNSFVIQPMLVDIYTVLSARKKCNVKTYEKIVGRAVRYAQIQERFISPEGTFPPVGRSLAYRTGCLQVLSMMALQHRLPQGVTPAQVRGALTAVAKRMFSAEGTFDADGWLQIGFAGHQPCVGEGYICTGSLYLCSVGFLHLGLPADDEFWKAPSVPWTSRKAWGGEVFPIDHAM